MHGGTADARDTRGRTHGARLTDAGEIYARRRWTPLVTTWLVGGGFAAALWYLGAEIPAIAGLLTPFYVVIGVVLVSVTWRWLRERGRGRERRRADRRHSDRRHSPGGSER